MVADFIRPRRRRAIEHLHLISVLLTPAHVHTHKHRSPIEAFGPSGTGIYIHDRPRNGPRSREAYSAFPAPPLSTVRRRKVHQFLLRRNTLFNEIRASVRGLGERFHLAGSRRASFYRGYFFKLRFRSRGIIQKLGACVLSCSSSSSIAF